MVSIIIPAYDTARYITESLNSVFSQTYKNYEIIVVNDGSPDTKELENVLESYRDRIIYLKQENQGAGPARNAGLKAASGELIAFLDSDDIWLPNFLESQVAFLKKGNFDVVWADAFLIGDPKNFGRNFMEKAPSKGEATLESLLEQKCNIIMSGTVSQKSAIMNVGGFEKYNIQAEDFDLWIRMAFSGARFGYQRRVLLKYRVHTEGLSGNTVQRIKREISVYSRFLETMPFNNRQKQIVESQIERLKSFLRIERGKSFLLEGNFRNAESEIKKANKYFRSVKIKAVLLLLLLAPRLLLWLFKWRRFKDLPFIERLNPTTKP